MENSTFKISLKYFLQAFDHPLHQMEAAKRLFSVHQGKQSMSEFPILFQMIAEKFGWGEKSQRGAPVNLLNDQIKDQLATRKEPWDLDKLINLSVRIDNRLWEWHTKENFWTV